MKKVFVYGTLKQGHSNHRLLRRSRCLGTAETAPRYELWDMGAFPALAVDGDEAVLGEVYEVDGLTLEALDRLEGTPRFYRRIQDTVRLESGQAVAAELYVMDKDRLEAFRAQRIAREWPGREA